MLTFEASSPDELKKFLSEQPGSVSSSPRLAALAISGPQVLVRVFQFGSVPSKELKRRLLHEAVELLSLPVSDIELMYQILGSADGEINGVYVCLPRKLLHRYLWVLYRAKFVPAHITAASAVYLASFFKDPQLDGRVCFLNFSNKKMICLAIFLQRKCELFREIPYENWAEATTEILQSLRSVCAKSSVKQFDRIYLVGADPYQEDLGEQIKYDFNAAVEHRPAVDLEQVLKETDLAGLNLAQNYIFPLNERIQILRILHLVIAVLLCAGIGLGVKIKMSDQLMNSVKNSYQPAEYQYAVELQTKLKASK